MELMEATGAPVFEGMFDQAQGGDEIEEARPGQGSAPPIGTPADANATSDARTNGGIPNGNTNIGAGDVEHGAGGALGASWADASVGPETLTTNPLFRAGSKKEEAGGGDGDGVPAPEAEIAEVMGQEDEGAGVFGAILHEPGLCVGGVLWILFTVGVGRRRGGGEGLVCMVLRSMCGACVGIR